MAPSEISRLGFLSNAADWLRVQSPSTSAHLLASQTQILHDDSKSLNVRQRRHHCGACGSIRQSEVTESIQVKLKGKSPASKTESSTGAKVYKCLRCRRRTVLQRKRGNSKHSSRNSTATALPVTSTTLPKAASAQGPSQENPASAVREPQTSKAAENANSKKRSKARKHGGLQALLASKQRTQPSLDLFDFLQ